MLLCWDLFGSDDGCKCWTSYSSPKPSNLFTYLKHSGTISFLQVPLCSSTFQLNLEILGSCNLEHVVNLNVQIVNLEVPILALEEASYCSILTRAVLLHFGPPCSSGWLSMKVLQVGGVQVICAATPSLPICPMSDKDIHGTLWILQNVPPTESTTLRLSQSRSPTSPGVL